MTSNPKMTQTKGVRERIENWLTDEEFSIWKFGDMDSRFSYKVSRNDCLPLSILQPQSKNDSIMIVSDIRLTDEDQKKLMKIPEKERKFMLFDFRMLMLSTGCQWQFLPSQESWKTIRVSKALFYDGLSKHKFFETVDVVHRHTQGFGKFSHELLRYITRPGLRLFQRHQQVFWCFIQESRSLAHLAPQLDDVALPSYE